MPQEQGSITITYNYDLEKKNKMQMATNYERGPLIN